MQDPVGSSEGTVILTIDRRRNVIMMRGRLGQPEVSQLEGQGRRTIIVEMRIYRVGLRTET
jgi:hypothetical protein